MERSQPVLPMRPGAPEKQTHEYYRHGTTTLFAALEVATGKVLGKCYARHTQNEFIEFLKNIEKNTPKDKHIHIILDNYADHKTQKVKRWL